eukprot:15163705-Alexandrium_andersonii.AAC.2
MPQAHLGLPLVGFWQASRANTCDFLRRRWATLCVAADVMGRVLMWQRALQSMLRWHKKALLTAAPGANSLACRVGCRTAVARRHPPGRPAPPRLSSPGTCAARARPPPALWHLCPTIGRRN